MLAHILTVWTNAARVLKRTRFSFCLFFLRGEKYECHYIYFNLLRYYKLCKLLKRDNFNGPEDTRFWHINQNGQCLNTNTLNNKLSFLDTKGLFLSAKYLFLYDELLRVKIKHIHMLKFVLFLSDYLYIPVFKEMLRHSMKLNRLN